MSDADNEVAVTTAGVTARKTLDPDRFDHPTVVVGLHADREEAVRVRLTEQIPADWGPENVGFDPEYGADHWAVADDRLVFERVLQPGRRYTTLYNVQDAPVGEPLAYEPALDVETVDDAESEAAPPASADHEEADGEGADGLEGLVSASDNDPVRGVIAGDRDSLSDTSGTVEVEPDATGADGRSEADGTADEEAEDGSVEADEPTPAVVSVADKGSGTAGDEGGQPADDEPADAADEDDSEAEPGVTTGGGGISTEAREAASGEGPATEGADETTADETAGEAADDISPDTGSETESETETAATPAATQPEGGVARVLAKELREDRVSEADRELLREQLGVGPESTEARIRHLQNEVSDLAAYTDALEAFIDDQGTADQILDGLDDLDDRVVGVEDRVQGFEEGLADLRDDLVALETDLRDEVRSVTADLEALETTVGELEKQVEAASASEEVAAVESDLDNLRNDVADLEEFREDLTTTLSRLTGDFGD